MLNSLVNENVPLPIEVIIRLVIAIALIAISKALKDFLNSKKEKLFRKKKNKILYFLMAAIVSLVASFGDMIVFSGSTSVETEPKEAFNSFDLNSADFIDVGHDTISNDIDYIKELHNNTLNNRDEIIAYNGKIEDDSKINYLVYLRNEAKSIDQKVQISREIYNYISNNEALLQEHTRLLQEYALELYYQKNTNAEKVFLEAIEMNIELLSLKDLSLCRSDILYRIAQCYEYLSCLQTPSIRDSYIDSLSAIAFFEFSYSSSDYKNAIHYGEAYAMSAMRIHKVMNKYKYDVDTISRAKETYKKAVEQLSPNNKYYDISNQGYEDLVKYEKLYLY